MTKNQNRKNFGKFSKKMIFSKKNVEFTKTKTTGLEIKYKL